MCVFVHACVRACMNEYVLFSIQVQLEMSLSICCRSAYTGLLGVRLRNTMDFLIAIMPFVFHMCNGTTRKNVYE